MFQRIAIFCILFLLVPFTFVVGWPSAAHQVATRVSNSIKALEKITPSLPSRTEAAFKIVDPEMIVTAVKEEVPHISAFFKRDKYQSAQRAKLNANDIVDATNRERIAHGLPPLRVNAELITSAKIKTDDMIALHYFEHESPNGKSVSDLGRDVGYDYLIMGENLALGNFDDANDLVAAWMASPGHRANILNPLYQEIGIYAAQGTYEGQLVWFAVQHFGTSRSTCPAVNKSLKMNIDMINANLDHQQQEIEDLKTQIEHADAKKTGYEEMVTEFNKKVSAYNDMLGDSRQKILQYNKQVSNFNLCLTQFQK